MAMSSDGDDLDEDELLQMALKEQSQRDVNYKKPTSSNSRSAPVANYVQQPHQQPPSKPAASPAPNHATRASNTGNRRRAVEEDDESDVDMLSISSGDEDSTAKDQQRARFRGGKAASAAAARRGSRGDDDAAWDGGEPGCWKHVDEAELARRVREMRETRSAPVAPKVERKVSTAGLARKGLNNLQSFPRGMECIDPLGFGIIDNKTLRLITKSSDHSPSKGDKLDNNLREKLLYFSEKFDAKLFISRIHQDTGASDLEAGALALKSDLKGQTQQRKQLVKDNFDCFVSCKTTIDDIESKLRRIEEDPEGSGTSHLFNCMQGVSSLANRAFQPLFERQAQAEKIRSVQGMLQRFRTLFNLPSTIRGSISKGEYDLAVREYKKAKSIALPSHVGILKRVLEEVEKVMHEFKGMLYKSMEDPQIDLTNGVRDAAVELLHTLVAVHAEVFSGAKPLLDKTLGILVEGLIDTFISLFHENKSKELRSLDANGFCQLMLELEYFETILNPYFTADARESLKSLQGVLLDKATESVSENAENPGHNRRATRGSEEAADDRQDGISVSPDDLIALAQQYSSELLQAELERTHINTACFVESIPLDSVPESAKRAYASFRGSLDSPSRNYRGNTGSPSYTRNRRR